MRTTIDLPDELFRRVKARAAMDGLKLKELITRYVERGLADGAQPVAGPVRLRRELPVAQPALGQPLPRMSNAELSAILEREEVAGLLGEEAARGDAA